MTFASRLWNLDGVHPIDCKDGLILFHYDKDTVKDATPEIRACRGTIVNKETGAVVCKSFPYTDEYTVNDLNDLFGDTDLSNFRFYKALEGSIIRIFYHNGEWYDSTHRRISAGDSRWSGPTFRQILRESIATTSPEGGWNATDPDKIYENEFLPRLNPERCYVFLAVNHPENRIACNDDTYYAKHLATFAPDGQGDMVEVEEDLGLVTPNNRLNFNTTDEIREYFANEFPSDRDYAEPGQLTSSGVICFDKAGIPYKIVASPYKYRFEMRGNSPTLRSRYLEVRNDPEKKAELLHHFPNQAYYDEIETQLCELAVLLHDLYYYRYITGGFLQNCPKEEYVFIQGCHSWHHEGKKTGDDGQVVNTHKVYANVVKQRLDQTDPVFVNRMLRRVARGFLREYLNNLPDPATQQRNIKPVE